MEKAAMNSHEHALYSLAVIQFNGSGGTRSSKDLRVGVALCAKPLSLAISMLCELGYWLRCETDYLRGEAISYSNLQSQLQFFAASKFLGINLKSVGKSKKTKQTAPEFDDLYLMLLVREGKIDVDVGAVTNEIYVYEVSAIKVTTLRFTKTARARIIKAGGECLTFDDLAVRALLG